MGLQVFGAKMEQFISRYEIKPTGAVVDGTKKTKDVSENDNGSSLKSLCVVRVIAMVRYSPILPISFRRTSFG